MSGGESRGFFAWLFGGSGRAEGTRVYSQEEIGLRELGGERRELDEEQQGFTVERAAEVIRDLPPDVSRESAVRIVRGTLEAAGVNVEDLGRSTDRRRARFNSEIELSEKRIREVKEATNEVVRSLEEQIERAREARDGSISEEEARISGARASIRDLLQVRSFFGFSEADESVEGVSPSDDTQVLEPLDESIERPFSDSEGEQAYGQNKRDEEHSESWGTSGDADETRVMRRRGPLAEEDGGGGEDKR